MTHQLPLAPARSALPCMELCFDILFMLTGDAGEIRLDTASRCTMR